MKQNYLWTKSKARLKLLRATNGKNYNWLFLLGGPGLGSESLSGLIEILHLPGTLWVIDLPGDGSNTTEDDAKNFAFWSEALIEAVSSLKNVILVAHSSGGMFALATPELEQILFGLVLISSAPNASWQSSFANYIKEHPLSEAEKQQKLYRKKPSNDLLKSLTIASAPYFSTKKSLKKILIMLNALPFNYRSHLWAEKNFDQSYKAKWIPKKIPTMIFTGNQDHITPLKLFSESAKFQRKNIFIYEIKEASHFPWLDKPNEVKQVFEKYYNELQNYLKW